MVSQEMKEVKITNTAICCISGGYNNKGLTLQYNK